MSKRRTRPPALRFAGAAPHVWEGLGKIERTGWVRRKVKNPETVQDHTATLRQRACDFVVCSGPAHQRLLDMLEVHDWPELIGGDEVTATIADAGERKRAEERKFEREYCALEEICRPLGAAGQNIMSLWLRFETSPDVIADFARQLDRFQPVEQALYYEMTQDIPLFREFADRARPSISHPQLLDAFGALEKKWRTLKR